VSELNPTAASLLGFLHGGPKTGWDLVANVEETIGYFWNLTRSQVYRELKALAEGGMVSQGASGPRDRQPYELTDAGRAAFAAWIAVEPGPELIRYPLLLTVFFGEHVAPGRLAEFLVAHRRAHAERLAHYQQVEAELRTEQNALLTPEARRSLVLQAQALKFGVLYEQSVLAWIDAFPHDAAPASRPAASKAAPARARRSGAGPSKKAPAAPGSKRPARRPR
jgi:DNA-binding PadR family transcriptional regulator